MHLGCNEVDLVKSLRVSSHFSKTAQTGVARSLLLGSGFTLFNDLYPEQPVRQNDENRSVLKELDRAIRVHNRDFYTEPDEITAAFKKIISLDGVPLIHGISTTTAGASRIETDITVEVGGSYCLLVELKKRDSDIKNSIYNGALAQLCMDYMKGLYLGANFGSTMYGIVTNCRQWQFVKFSGKEIRFSECFDISYYFDVNSVFNYPRTKVRKASLVVASFLNEIFRHITRLKEIQKGLTSLSKCIVFPGTVSDLED